MVEYLKYKFEDTLEHVSTFDELPLWSASFGLMMLKHLELKPKLTVVDIGSGAGFPLLELGERLGNSCKLYGIDPWVNANTRVKQKIKNYNITNVEIIETSAEHIPFDDNSIDLIVSNLGINNFDKPEVVFSECCRVLKPNGRLALTTNINGHWKEFYNIFESTLTQLGKSEYLSRLTEQQEHRGSIETVSRLFADSRLTVTRVYKDSFEMKFLDGSAFLNHHFVKLGWLSSWIGIFPAHELEAMFEALEENLNVYAAKEGRLTLSVPMLFIEGEKQ